MTAIHRIFVACLTMALVSSVTAQEDAPTDSSAEFHGGVRGVFPNVELPSHVPAPYSKLTLYADFAARDAYGVPLFLVNRTDQPTTFSSQDGDIYLKLEHLLPSGKWERAQSHVSSWCGNSYGGITVNPGQHFRLYGYMPTSGSSARAETVQKNFTDLLTDVCSRLLQ